MHVFFVSLSLKQWKYYMYFSLVLLNICQITEGYPNKKMFLLLNKNLIFLKIKIQIFILKIVKNIK